MSVANLLRAAPQKLYVQVADLLRGQIREGCWLPGARLPNLEDLASHFGVAVVTVRQAIAILEEEGLVRSRHGRGTFVEKDLKQKNIWLRMDSRWGSLVEKWEGTKPNVVAVKEHTSCPPLARTEGLPAKNYHYMRRVHVSGDMPYCVVDLYLAQHVYDRAPKRFDAERILAVLDNLPSVKVKHAREIITISSADAETARLLAIPLNSPVGAVRRLLIDENEILVCIADVIYRGDVVRIERNLDR